MNYIWFLIILISIASAAYTGKIDAVVNAVMTGCQKAIETGLYLAGIMAFWLGIMKIAEKSGLVQKIAQLIKPAAKFLFPDIPEKNPVIGDIAMNFTANAFGLANAATPIGIEAMKKLQDLNKDKNSASNDMCTLLAMNTAGWQLVPATVIAVLVSCGSKNPTEIVFPTLIVTTIAFVSAIVSVKILERFTKPQLPAETNEQTGEEKMLKTLVSTISVWLIPAIILVSLLWGVIKKVPVYETFVDGAKDGLKVSVSIVPYLLAIIVAVSMLRASGAIDIAQHLLAGFLDWIKVPVDVLPVMIIRSLSGSAVLGLFSEIANNYGPDAYATKLAAIMVGSSETTFYVLAVYFGSVGIKKFRHALCAGIFADIIGIIAAVAVARWLFL